MAKNYIVTSTHTHDSELPVLTFEELYNASFSFQTPFHFDLIDHQFFSANRVVRLIPKKRMVVFGVFQNKNVVAKLFFDPKQSKAQMLKDLAGIELLKKNKIPTPEFLYQGSSIDKKIYVLIFEQIMHARNLEEIWREKKNRDEVLPIFKQSMIEIATQHVLGLIQHDLHLKNFLWDEKTLYTLDGGQIEASEKLLSKKVSMKNLALFLSQLGVDSENYQEILFTHYAKARGWTLKDHDKIEIFKFIKQWNESRWKKYLKKIFRDSSDYVKFKDKKLKGMFHRRYESPEFSRFLSKPDSAFYFPDTVLLKAGRSATVIKVKLGDTEFVVKRYNLKGVWHRIKRCFKKTRARNSWELAQKFFLFDVLTAKPIAFIEKKWLGLPSKSYYVTEYIKGVHANDYFRQMQHQPEKISTMVKRITALLKNVAKIEVIHGDLKITNILVDHDEQPWLIDLDGATEHTLHVTLKKAWRKEIMRFLANFDAHRLLRKEFEEEFEKNSS